MTTMQRICDLPKVLVQHGLQFVVPNLGVQTVSSAISFGSEDWQSVQTEFGLPNTEIRSVFSWWDSLAGLSNMNIQDMSTCRYVVVSYIRQLDDYRNRVLRQNMG